MIYKALERELKELKTKTFIAQTNYGGWTPPMNLLSVGPKRCHISVYVVGKYYLKTITFIEMIYQDIHIVDDATLAKYMLTDGQKDLLDI